jgi:hypothetical protein
LISVVIHRISSSSRKRPRKLMRNRAKVGFEGPTWLSVAVESVENSGKILATIFWISCEE